MDGFHQHNVDLKKPDTEKYILYDFKYLEV